MKESSGSAELRKMNLQSLYRVRDELTPEKAHEMVLDMVDRRIAYLEEHLSRRFEPEEMTVGDVVVW